MFFPIHDLSHYAVETVLGFRSGFYGLVAAGWDIADTTGKGARGPLPEEAVEVEYIVGALGSERAGDVACSAAQFNEQASLFAQTRGLPAPRALTDDELNRVRTRIYELCAQWSELAPDSTLQLPFPLL